MNEQEKKRVYSERILQIDHATFTSLVFSVNSSGKGVPKYLLALGKSNILKARPFGSRFQVSGFEPKFALG